MVVVIFGVVGRLRRLIALSEGLGFLVRCEQLVNFAVVLRHRVEIILKDLLWREIWQGLRVGQGGR